jgi:hypothetical protein
VVAVGAGKKAEKEGEAPVAPNVAIGQTVMYSKYSGTEFEVLLWSGALVYLPSRAAGTVCMA